MIWPLKWPLRRALRALCAARELPHSRIVYSPGVNRHANAEYPVDRVLITSQARLEYSRPSETTIRLPPSIHARPIDHTMEPALTTADDLAAKMHDVMTLDDAEIARLKCVAASGKVYDAEGQDERREAAHRLWLHYSARAEGTRLKEGQMKNEARDWSGSIFYLIRPACDRHPETCWEQYKLCSQAEEKEAERIGVLRTRVASVEFKFLRFASDGGHVQAMHVLALKLQTVDFVRETLEMTA